MQPLRIMWKSSNTMALLGFLRSVNTCIRPAPERLLEELRVHGKMPSLTAPARDTAIRAMVRTAAFKPSGRNRPAQEYLGKMARSSTGLPSICNVVDINNLFSLKHRLPASIVDTHSLGHEVVVREGSPGETYAFNASGQSLRLEGLLCLSRGDGAAVASPIKDAVTAHVAAQTTSVVACIYGSSALLSAGRMVELVEEYARYLTEFADAKTVEKIVASCEEIRYVGETP